MGLRDRENLLRRSAGLGLYTNVDSCLSHFSRMDGDVWHRFYPSLRIVSSPVVGLAARWNLCHSANAKPDCGDIARGILEQERDHGVQRTRIRVHVSPATAVDDACYGDPAGLWPVGTDP